MVSIFFEVQASLRVRPGQEAGGAVGNQEGSM